jgi:hypothetical protein
MAYTTIDNPELYFQTKLYTGNSTQTAITLDGSENMQPDWVWIKTRSVSNGHTLIDSIRGVTKRLASHNNQAEVTDSTMFVSFDSDGFTLGSDTNDYTNYNNQTHAAWNWKAGTSFTNDASSTGIGTIDSSGSVSDTAGFSIISYTGSGSAATIAHGLGSAPNVVIIKRRNTTGEWVFGHTSLGFTKFIEFNSSGASQTSSTRFNDTAPTSSVFSIGTAADTNTSGGTYIAYCFAEKKGYSKFGSYTGNGNADGSFIYLGFKPKLVIIKRTTGSSYSWHLQNSEDDGANPTNYLVADTTAAEVSSYPLDFLAQGFKPRNSLGGFNGSGAPYIYMAFAESPFVNSAGAVPTNAR